MRIIIPTELRRLLIVNQKARYRFKNLSIKAKRELVSFVIEGPSRKSRRCRSARTIKVLEGMRGNWLVPC